MGTKGSRRGSSRDGCTITGQGGCIARKTKVAVEAVGVPRRAVLVGSGQVAAGVSETAAGVSDLSHHVELSHVDVATRDL